MLDDRLYPVYVVGEIDGLFLEVFFVWNAFFDLMQEIFYARDAVLERFDIFNDQKSIRIDLAANRD